MTAGGGLPSSSSSGLPPRRWWRRASYYPLILLTGASIVALVVGAATTVSQRTHPVPTPQPDPTSEADAQCRQPIEPPNAEPWLAGDGSAEQEWQRHAEEVGLPYVIGPNGWIFWSDYIEQYASQAVGRETLTQEELQNWVDYYSSVRDGLAAEGVDFRIVITPSTSSIYPEELPEWMQPLRGSTIMDQFMAAADDLPVIDLRGPLRDAKREDVHLYSWSNSHWTDYGGYVGWSAIVDCLAASGVGHGLRVPEISGFEIVGDFNEWASFGVPSPGADWSVPIFTEPLQEVTYTDAQGVTTTAPGNQVIDASWLPVTTTVQQSWTGKSALILRDSMGGALSPYWDQAYSPTWQLGQTYVSYDEWPHYRELVAQYRPDVVILQLAERHLVNAPPASASY